MTNKIFNKNNSLKFSLLIFFIFIWFSLDTNFENVPKVFNELNSTNLLLFLRSILPFIIFFIICTIIYKNKKNINLKKSLQDLKFTYLIFFSYLITKLIGHYLSENFFIFTYYFYLSFFLLFYIYFAAINGLLNFSFYFSLFVLIIIFSIFGFLSLKYFITNGDLHFYGTFPDVYKSILTVSTNVIRSSGLSRTAILIFIPLFIYFLISPISKKIFFFNFIIIFTILLTQSRLSNIFLIIFFILCSIWYLKNYKLYSYFKKFFILVILPFLITGILISSKYYLLVNKIIIVDSKNVITGVSFFNAKKIVKDLNLGNNLTETSDDNNITKPTIVRKIDPSTYSSGRVKYWKQILKKNKNYLTGNGYLGDRLLIKNNASNIIFYTFASGGVIGLILIVLLILRSAFICFDLMFIKQIKFERKNFIAITSIFYIAFLTFRGIGENSYAIFSIDQIVFFQSLIIIEIYRNKLSKR